MGAATPPSPRRGIPAHSDRTPADEARVGRRFPYEILYEIERDEIIIYAIRRSDVGAGMWKDVS